MATLMINGVLMPEPKTNGLIVRAEKVWSSKTGRAANAEMLGDLVAIKITLDIQWPALTQEDVNKIDEAISPAFFEVTFENPRNGQSETRMFYANSPTYPVYSYALKKCYQGVAVTLIEK